MDCPAFYTRPTTLFGKNSLFIFHDTISLCGILFQNMGDKKSIFFFRKKTKAPLNAIRIDVRPFEYVKWIALVSTPHRAHFLGKMRFSFFLFHDSISLCGLHIPSNNSHSGWRIFHFPSQKPPYSAWIREWGPFLDSTHYV